MDLKEWLRTNAMETNEFAARVGCTRKTIWRAKKGLTVDPVVSRMISFITGGQVNPESRSIGRPRKNNSVKV